jgi:hypothetical protein
MFRSPALLATARYAPCCFGCGGPNRGDVVAAHSNQLRDAKGRGIKAHDYRVAHLCFTCHAELDQGRKMSREERVAFWEEAHRKTVGWLFETGRLQVVAAAGQTPIYAPRRGPKPFEGDL